MEIYKKTTYGLFSVVAVIRKSGRFFQDSLSNSPSFTMSEYNQLPNLLHVRNIIYSI